MLAHGADDYWLVNCSNVKPHAMLLDLIARCWRDGTVDAGQQCIAYTAAYYGLLYRCEIAQCLADYVQFAVPYGPHEDDHAGDQFYNHVPRMLISQFIQDRTAPAENLRWLCEQRPLPGSCSTAPPSLTRQSKAMQLPRECEKVLAELTGARACCLWTA